MSITLIIIIATCIISILCLNDNQAKMKLIFHPFTINKYKSQWPRFITCGFIHADYLHLGFNMYAFYSFGSILEKVFFPTIFGSYYQIAYILFYISAIFVADIYTYFKHKNNNSYYSLGASGAVSSVIYACILFAPNLMIMGMPGWLYGFIYLGFSSYAANKNIGNIAHDAHIWGAIYGLILPLIFKPTLYFDFINNIIN
jgi:membrane associated rhomboid family serine protease